MYIFFNTKQARALATVLFLILSQTTIRAEHIKDTNDVRQTYLQIIAKHQPEKALGVQCWNEVAQLYSDTTRYYHTLQHLANFYNELSRCQPEINNWDAVFLSMVYHDVIYVATNRDNEELSAEMAAAHLNKLGFSKPFVDTCRQLIMATKTHKATNDTTTNYFIDADMSILGVPLEQYKTYVGQVYKEYAAVLNFAEKRKSFLKHFLQTERIFITKLFYGLYEQPARLNLQKEITDFQ